MYSVQSYQSLNKSGLFKSEEALSIRNQRNKNKYTLEGTKKLKRNLKLYFQQGTHFDSWKKNTPYFEEHLKYANLFREHFTLLRDTTEGLNRVTRNIVYLAFVKAAVDLLSDKKVDSKVFSFNALAVNTLHIHNSTLNYHVRVLVNNAIAIDSEYFYYLYGKFKNTMHHESS